MWALVCASWSTVAQLDDDVVPPTAVYLKPTASYYPEVSGLSNPCRLAGLLTARRCATVISNWHWQVSQTERVERGTLNLP
ncbi:uncharacterized protein C8Q71DRAFT_738733 [Rhodofomes roseus]|uniref:Secreted protein n=1 Tax=Rhodofomes roseus TaxID=34475 RepID=A0ABQ8KSS7_9APHY|nr:uncharacterized protein C8Q71DRAFT_738733 [Rhodofomes roseus]KAH9841772.1 hypothetical protein C8Q71DRAFT_738733 [Rhodofomes roseus]